MIKLFWILLLVTNAANAKLHVIKGTHFESDYEFAMSDEYQDLHGTWGESKYRLDWDSYNLRLKGTTAGETQNLYIDTLMNKIELTAYCGWADLFYSLTAPYFVKGTLCLLNIDKRFSTLKESQDYIVHESLVRMTTEFPEPAKVPVMEFLKTLVQFEPVH